MKLVIISFLSNNSDPRSAPRVQNIISAIESDSHIIVLNKYIEDKKLKNVYYKKINFKIPNHINRYAIKWESVIVKKNFDNLQQNN